MAANFWTSSHGNHWLLDRQTLQQARAEDYRYATQQEMGWICIWSANMMTRFAKRLSLRQQVIATAILFFRRFYVRNSYCDTDLCLLTATCIYVAAKAEEQPVHVKSVVSEARQLFNDVGYTSFPSDQSKLAEMEFYLIEDLDFHLIVHHPYKALLQMCGKDSAKLPGMLDIDDATFQMAWFIVNDTYRTDLCLLYPPHLIAVAAVYLAFAINPPTKKPQNKQAQPSVSSHGAGLASAPSPSGSTDPSSASGPPKSTSPSATPSPLSNVNQPAHAGPSGASTKPHSSTSATSTASAAPQPAPPSNPKLLHPSLPARPTFDAFSNNRTSPQPSKPGAIANSAAASSAASTPAQAAAAPPPQTAPGPVPKRDPVTFLSDLDIPLHVVLEIVQEMVSLYTLWHVYDEGPSASMNAGGGNSPLQPPPLHPNRPASASQLMGTSKGSDSLGPNSRTLPSSHGASPASSPVPGSMASNTNRMSSDERVLKILARMRDARAMEHAQHATQTGGGSKR